MTIGSMTQGRSAAVRRGGIGALALALSLAAVQACATDGLLDVDDIDVANPTSVQTKAALPLLLNGALGDVQGGFSGFGGDALVTGSGEFSDELQFVETFPTRQEFDQRGVALANPINTTIFRNLLRGWAAAVRAQEAYARLDPAVAGRAMSYNLEAFSIILLAESYCSGVPFSRLTESGATLYGEPLTRDAMLSWAVAATDSALTILNALPAADTVAANRRHFASILKARALLNQGKPAEAATAVAAVPTTFVLQFQHSANTARQNNGVFGLTFLDPRMSVSNAEGTNGLAYRADNDPRVPQRRGTGTGGEPSVGFDGSSPMYLQLKYTSRASNATVASGVEARLIEAEAKLAAGDAVGALATLNTLRLAPGNPGSGGVAGLTPLVDAGSANGRVDQLFKERAYWMWLTAHRLGDLRRLVRQYGRPPDSVFPTGAYVKGGQYGVDVNLPVPADELNNPKFTGCLDRGA